MNETYHKAKSVVEDLPHVETYFNQNFTIEFLSVQTWFDENVELHKSANLTEVYII